MNKIKKLWDETALFWIGGIMGVVQQLLGGHNIEVIMGNLGLYATIIILLIIRDKPPKRQFRDIFLFFLGLDLFYYAFLFFLDISFYFEYNKLHSDHGKELKYFFQRSFSGIEGLIYWTTIATAASFWGYLAVKFRLKEYKKRYCFMLVPLVSVLVIEIIRSAMNIERSYVLAASDTICLAVLMVVFMKNKKNTKIAINLK